MTRDRWLNLSERWARLLLRFYPADFRDEMGDALVEAYVDRCRYAMERGGAASVVWLWLRALADSAFNGIGERVRPAVAWRRSGNWGMDAQLVIRRLTRAPVFTASMIATLTVGLGAFAMVFTVVQKVLIAPLPYEKPDDLYFVWRNYTWVPLERGWVAGPDVAALKGAGGAIKDAVGLRLERVTMSRGGTADPTEVAVMVSTADLFDILGVRAARGRTFSPNESGPGRPPVIVLGDELWRTRFGGDSTIVGSEIRLDDRPYTVVGIMKKGFRFMRHSSLGPAESADAYITFDTDLARESPNAGAFAVLVRGRPGAAPKAVAAAVNAVASVIDQRDFRSRGLRLDAVSAKDDLVSRVRPALQVLGAAGAFLVLVLAVNLATLLLSRAAHREREFAISRALGANHVTIARATLLEGALLGAFGGIGATLVAIWGTRALVALAPSDLPRREAIAVDWRIGAIVVGVGITLGLLAALVPALWATRTRLVTLMANANVRGGGGHGRMRRGMVVVQVALSLVLLTTGGLVVRSFERLLRANPGFDPAGVLTMRVPVSRDRFPTLQVATPLHERLERELSALPGVTAVGAASAMPLTANVDQTSFAAPGAPGNTGVQEHDKPLVDYIPARGRYIEALGIRVLAGRAFGSARAGARREVLIDRTLASELFPNASAVGALVVLDGADSATVIGVVEHARQYDIHQDGRPQVYIRNEDGGYRTLSFALRTKRSPADLIPEARAAVRRVDPQLAISDVKPMEDLVGESLRQQRLSAVLITGFSLGALMLAAMGLFGIISGSVSRRRHEIAVRLALGADHGQVLRLVLREGAGLVIGGVLLGVPGIYFAGRAVAGMLVGVSAFDAVTLGAVAGGLALVAAAACYIPARRVTGIEPARAFREE